MDEKLKGIVGSARSVANFGQEGLKASGFGTENSLSLCA